MLPLSHQFFAQVWPGQLLFDHLQSLWFLCDGFQSEDRAGKHPEEGRQDKASSQPEEGVHQDEAINHQEGVQEETCEVHPKEASRTHFLLDF